MFHNCTSLISFPDLSKLEKSKYSIVINWMFDNCISLISLPDIFKSETEIDENTSFHDSEEYDIN